MHGLVYPQDFLSTLSQQQNQIRTISPSQFAALHLNYLLSRSHTPDTVLFPFLHGLEGSNAAQRQFFAHVSQNTPLRVPKYRGLVWVVCDDDFDPAPQPPEHDNDNDDDLDDDPYSDESISDLDQFAMDIDVDTDLDVHIHRHNDDCESADTDTHQLHMHPVHHRLQPLPTTSATKPLSHSPTVPLIQTNLPQLDRRASVASTASTSTTSAASSFFPSSTLSSPATSITSAYPARKDDASADAELDSPTPLPGATFPPAKVAHDEAEVRALPLLTSTFYPKDLLTVGFDGVPEFVPLRVPDGISLRNFGIQVPIYATLSDIVVYSPKGLTPAALALAEKFSTAIKRKAEERARARRRAGGAGTESDLVDTKWITGWDNSVAQGAKWGVAKGAGNGWGPDQGEQEGAWSAWGASNGWIPAQGEDTAHDGWSSGGTWDRWPEPEEIRTDGRDIDGEDSERMEDGEREGGGDQKGVDQKGVDQKVVDGHKGGAENVGAECKADAEQVDNENVGAEQTGAEHKSSTEEKAVDEEEPLTYNVFVMTGTAEEMEREMPHLMVRMQGARQEPRAGPGRRTSLQPNTIDFAQREKDEMRDLTRASEIISVFGTDTTNLSVNPTTATTEKNSGRSASASGVDLRTTKTHWNPLIGQVFLGNSNDVPLVPETVRVDDDPFDYTMNDPANGFGYDICIECHDFAPLPSVAHLRAAEEHLAMLDEAWVARCRRQQHKDHSASDTIPPRPPPSASAVIHLPFPSSPPSTSGTMSALIPVVKFLERVLQPPSAADAPAPATATPPPPAPLCSSRRWSSSVSSLMTSFPLVSASSFGQAQPTRHRAATSPIPSGPTSSPSSLPPSPSPSSASQPRSPPTATATRTRPLKILIYSSDGYTESSVPALCLVMAVRRVGLPEAYLELQVVKRRSFFVYQGDLGVLRRVESRLAVGGDRDRAGGRRNGSGFGAGAEYASSMQPRPSGRPAANSVSFSQSPLTLYPPAGATTATTTLSSSSPTESPTQMIVPSQSHLVKSRPRASTSPWLPSVFGGDHQAWFNDPRFDGSFPSRVLPFLYLGNLNHASNAYMLHALGITHVVSVGECALVPPAHVNAGCPPNGVVCHLPGTGPHFIAGKGPGHQGSLWIEEKEGRIKVLDIKGVCDDGIDTLEPQLEPICAWIEKARLEGGQVLVHCRVGVSRSATVTIAYVMKHLGLPLVDAYLIVRSRRLSVLIQPNMRLLYNLCGWEVKLARERAGDDETRLKEELARTLSWPYLAKEVHALNEKYLH